MILKADYKDIKWVMNEFGEFPSTYSDNACRIISQHYFAKGEESFFDVVRRVVNVIAWYGYAHGYFTNPGIEHIEFARRLGGYLLRQQAAFNSPVYYNVGVEDNPQCSACFIQSVDDTMESILDLAKKEGMLFKYGSGTGTNLSSLRGKGADLSCGGDASGPVAFMRMYDAVASTIKSGGRTRRAAKMVLLDHNHPDIEEFIWCKAKEDRKAKRLIEAGFTPEEAYDSVQFQNGNNSVRVTDEFMRWVEFDGGEDTPVESEDKSASANYYFDSMCQAAWECGDPGIQFVDAIQKGLPKQLRAVEGLRINASNPCSEFLFLDNSACNLASINIAKVDNNQTPLGHMVKDLIFAMDIIVDLAGYPTEEIEQNSKKYRPLGLGLTAVGEYCMRHGKVYGSQEACDWLGTTMAVAEDYALRASNQLAARLGSMWDPDDKLRNAQLTLMAPTGTISFMMDAESTGIEPVVAESTVKHLSDGTKMEIIPECVKIASAEHGNHVVKTALGKNQVTVDEHLAMMAAIQPYLSGGISKTINMPHDCTPDDIRDVYVKAWRLGLKSISVYRDGSKGHQPVETKPSPQDVGAALTYTKMLDLGEPGDLNHPPVNMPPNGRVKLPDTRESITHKFSVGGVKGYLTVGLYAEDYPGEIFVNISKEGSTIGGLCDAWATAFSMGLQYGVPLEKLVRKFKGSSFSPAGFTESVEVRSATSIVDYIASWLEVHFLQADSEVFAGGEGPHGSDQVWEPVERGGDITGNTCPECGNGTVRAGACFACPHCGWNGGCG